MWKVLLKGRFKVQTEPHFKPVVLSALSVNASICRWACTNYSYWRKFYLHLCTFHSHPSILHLPSSFLASAPW